MKHFNSEFDLAPLVLTTRQAAKLLNLSPATLESWRCLGKGPAWCRAGRAIRYRRADLERFVSPPPDRPPMTVEEIQLLPESLWTRLPDVDGQECYRAEGDCYVLLSVPGVLQGQAIDYNRNAVVRRSGNVVYLPKGYAE